MHDHGPMQSAVAAGFRDLSIAGLHQKLGGAHGVLANLAQDSDT